MKWQDNMDVEHSKSNLQKNEAVRQKEYTQRGEDQIKSIIGIIFHKY